VSRPKRGRSKAEVGGGGGGETTSKKKQTLSQAERQIAILEARVIQLQNENEARVRDLQHANNLLHETNHLLHEETADLTRKMQTLTGQIQTLTGQITNLTEQIQTLTVDNEDRGQIILKLVDERQFTNRRLHKVVYELNQIKEVFLQNLDLIDLVINTEDLPESLRILFPKKK
jgi:uncharacterized protein YaaN involved in tellurite resistance